MRRASDLARWGIEHLRTVYVQILKEPLNKGRRARFFLDYFRWHLFYRHRGRKWLLTFDNGLRSWVYPNPQHGHDGGEPNIWTRNVDYRDEMLIRSVLTPGDFIVDAGCNIGNRVWPIADLLSGALLIDAGDAAIARVRENLALNGLDERDFVPVCKAVGETVGEVWFTDIGGAHTQNKVVEEPEAGSNGRRVEVTTIDIEVERLGRSPSFIKVDVEGQDLPALRGALRTLRSGSVKLVKFEHLPQEPLDPMLQFFRELGWTVFGLDAAGRRTTDQRDIESNLNLFAAPEDHLARTNR